MSQTITAELVSLDTGLGADKSAVIRALADRVVAQGRATDGAALYADAWAREQKDETGLPGGIAIPHAKSAAVTEPSLAFARLTPGVDFGAPDGPADLVFLIAAPDGAAEAHLAVLSKLARSLMQDDFTAGLRAATTADEVVAIVRNAIGEGDASSAPAAAPAAAATTTAAAAPAAAASDALSIDGRPVRIVAVTSCATGIAHTFMAADALTAARQEGRHRPRRRASGLQRLPGDRPAHHRRRRRGHLRQRRRRARAEPLRRQARRALRRQARHRAARAAHRRGRRRGEEPPRCPRRHGGGRGRVRRRRREEPVVGREHPAHPPDRRQLHDPLRRRRRSAHRHRLPAGRHRLRHRRLPDRPAR